MKYSKLVVLATLTMTATIWAGVPIVVAPDPDPDNMLEWSQKINVSIEETNDNTATNLARAAEDVSITACTLGGSYEYVELYMVDESGTTIWSSDNFHNYEIVVTGSSATGVNGTYRFSGFNTFDGVVSVSATNEHTVACEIVGDDDYHQWTITPLNSEPLIENFSIEEGFPPTAGWSEVTLTYANNYDLYATWKYYKIEGDPVEWTDFDLLPDTWPTFGQSVTYGYFRCIPSNINVSTANLFGVRVKNKNYGGYAENFQDDVLIRISHPIPVR